MRATYTTGIEMNQSDSIPLLLQDIKASFSKIHLLLNKTHFLQSEHQISALNDVYRMIRLIDEYLSNPAYQSPNYVSRLDLSIMNYIDNNFSFQEYVNWSEQQFIDWKQSVDCLMVQVERLGLIKPEK